MLNVKYSVSKGGSYARGTTIDGYLSENDCKILYERWKKAWGEPLGFRGGSIAITADMILSVPEEDFRKVYKSNSDAILQAARDAV